MGLCEHILMNVAKSESGYVKTKSKYNSLKYRLGHIYFFIKKCSQATPGPSYIYILYIYNKQKLMSNHQFLTINNKHTEKESMPKIKFYNPYIFAT